jgi:hypothetical protein
MVKLVNYLGLIILQSLLNFYHEAHKQYLTLRLVLSLYNSQKSEMIFFEKYEVDMFKIIIIIVGYTLNNLTTHRSRCWKII